MWHGIIPNLVYFLCDHLSIVGGIVNLGGLIGTKILLKMQIILSGRGWGVLKFLATSRFLAGEYYML
jgi:hypothetical protein